VLFNEALLQKRQSFAIPVKLGWHWRFRWYMECDKN